MRITIRDKNGTPPSALERLADKKLQKLERYFRRIDSIEVTHTSERGHSTIELNVEGDGLTLRSEERCPDLQAAVDNAVDKMERQIQRFKARVRNDHRRPSSDKEALPGTPEQADEEADEALSPETPRISRVKRYVMKPVTPEEAARQMELLDHTFFLFRNVLTDEVNVLYRRRDGTYGLIEPGA